MGQAFRRKALFAIIWSSGFVCSATHVQQFAGTNARRPTVMISCIFVVLHGLTNMFCVVLRMVAVCAVACTLFEFIIKQVMLLAIISLNTTALRYVWATPHVLQPLLPIRLIIQSYWIGWRP